MSFAEIIFRVGTAIAGWLIFIGHSLLLAVLHQADCDPTTEELWRGTMFFGFLTAVGMFFVGRGLQWSESLRWLAAPAALLAVYAAVQIAPGVSIATLDGESLCGIARPGATPFAGIQASAIERVWPPFQLAVLALGLVQAARYWGFGGPTPE